MAYDGNTGFSGESRFPFLSAATPVGSASVTLGPNGVTVNGSLFGRELVNETLTMEELTKLLQEGAVAAAA